LVTLDRYIARGVLLAMAVVLLILGGLDFLFTAIDELGDTSDSYSTGAALRYVLFTFPRHVYELLPMTALIGALTGLGMLAAGNELVAMQVAGVPVRRIVLAVMKPAFVVMLLGLVLGEFLAPRLELSAELGKSLSRGEEVGLSRYGQWQRDGSAFIHYNGVDPDGILYQVSLLQFDEQQRLVRSVQARRAVYLSGDQANQVQRELNRTQDGDRGNGRGTTRWQLEEGNEARFRYAESGRVEAVERNYFPAQQWELDLSPDFLQVLIVDADKMAMSDLWRYAQRFERQGQNASLYYLSFWKKTLQPLTTAVLVLVAVSFIFGPLREATMGSRVFTAICFGLLFTILQRLVHNVALVYQFSPLTAVLLPLLFTALLGAWLFRRAA
jgi:lipopolysaccharide export system permease protein